MPATTTHDSHEKAQYIDTPEALQQFCNELAGKPYVAIDTEFLRERTYRPELCLVQIKHEDLLACIDTIALDNLDPLWEVLFDESVVKVLHAASQDLEIFYVLNKRVPTPIFDTQLAAPLLGYTEQIGYANLVRERLQIELSKSQTRADWTRRPLTDQQVAYALDDVIYLEKLYLSMRNELQSLDRLAWLTPEFAAWEDPKRYDQPAADRWLKVKNVQRYKGPALAVIQALAEWRELKARETNKPRNWIFKDDVLVSLAQQRPDSAAELRHIRSLDKRAADRYGGELIDCIAKAAALEPTPLPPFARKKKLNAQTQAHVQLLLAWAHQRAADLNIHPTLLAPTSLLENLVTNPQSDAGLGGWRGNLLDADFRALLAGKVAISKTGSQHVEPLSLGDT